MEPFETPVPSKPDQDTIIEVFSPEDDQADCLDCVETTSIGDLYLLGKLWVDILKTGLLGTRWNVSSLPSILPVVEAATPPPTPQKPPKMKYKDLPLYSAPHYEYKDYVEDGPKRLCPEHKRKLIHEKVLPHLKSYRKEICQNYTDFVNEASSMKKTAMASIRNEQKKIICYMRSCENLAVRQGMLVLGGLAGFFLSRNIKEKTSVRVLYTAAGVLAAGALCFPDETDETVRNMSWVTGKLLVKIYNRWCIKGFGMREQVPCQSELPGPPGSRVANKCPEK